MKDWGDYSAGFCILALSLGFNAEVANTVVPLVSDA